MSGLVVRWQIEAKRGRRVAIKRRKEEGRIIIIIVLGGRGKIIIIIIIIAAAGCRPSLAWLRGWCK